MSNDNTGVQVSKRSLKKAAVEAHNRAYMDSQKTEVTIDELTQEERQELNSLSKEVYGASSRWHKLVNQGYAKLTTKEVSEFVPNTETKEVTETKVTVPNLRPDGAKMSVQTRHTVGSVKAEMLDRKAKLNEIRAIMKKQRDDANAKRETEKLANRVHEELSGTAV